MADKTLKINLIAKDDVSGPMRTIAVEADKTSGSLQKAGTDGAKGMDQVSEAAERTSQSLESSAIAAGAFGATILSALVVPIGLGTKAAWDQVSAVEQATLAFRAYETDVSKVNAVLDELIAYARSDLGRLFQREELFGAAQGLKVMGAETENLSRYVEIMGRSVAIGVGNWDELVRVIGRVGSTGRLAGEDFDMLTKMGYQLDSSLRNQTMSWESLFDVLDSGISAVGGQTETIVGQLTMTSSALRSLGQDFLGVDENSRFADQSLGAFAVGSLSSTRDLLEALSPVARGAGEALAFLGGGAALAVEMFTSLPSGVQTTIVTLVGGFGALTLGASATVLAFNKIGAAGAATRATFVALGNTIRAHPILFIASVVGGVALSAWAKHRSSVQQAEAAYEAFETAAKSVQQTIADTWLSGDFATGSVMDMVNRSTSAGIDRWEVELNRGKDLYGDFTEAVIDRDQEAADRYLESNFFQNVMEVARREGLLDESVIDAVLAGDLEAIEHVLPLIEGAMEQYWSSYMPTEGDRAAILQAQDSMFQLLLNPDIDSNQVLSRWFDILDEHLVGAEFPNLQGVANDWAAAEAEIVRSIDGIATSLDGLTDSQREFRLEMAQLRLDGDGALADDLESIRWLIGDVGDLSDEAASYVEFFIKNVENGTFALEDYSDELFVLQQMYRNGIIDQEGFESGLMHIALRAADAEIALRALTEELFGIGSELNSLVADAFEAELALRHLTDAVGAGIDQGIETYAASHEDYLERVAENLNALIEVAGYGDPLSRWNLQGNATDLSLLAMNAQQAAGSLDSVFRVAVGNTNAIGSQFDQIFKWAEDLIDKEGVWSKLDDLVISGRIEGTIGDFTDGSDYALAQQAFNSIAEDNVRLQESILTIQAKQAPIIAEQVSAYEELMFQIAEMPANQQLIALGWMDSTTAMRAMEFQTLAVAAATGQLGANGEEVFASVITGAAAADPVLKALLIDMGLIEEGADGTITVNFDSVSDGKSEIMMLIDSIDALILVLGGIPPAHLTVVDEASGPIQSVIDLINSLPDKRTTTIQTVLETVERYVGPTPYALGGLIPEYATGGVLFRGGELGPEIAHFAGGGTALLPRDGYYSAPAGTYISPNNAVSNSYGGISIDFSGAVFHNASREEMNAWAQEDFLPEIRRATADLKVGLGVS